MARVEGTRRADGQFMPLVVVTILLEVPNADPVTMSVLALIDSGADQTTMPAELLAGSGLTFENLPQIGRESRGVGGKAEVRYTPGRMLHDEHPFIDGEVQVIQNGALPGVVLGRSDFMATFKVDFEWHKDPPIFHVNAPKYPKA